VLALLTWPPRGRGSDADRNRRLGFWPALRLPGV